MKARTESVPSQATKIKQVITSGNEDAVSSDFIRLNRISEILVSEANESFRHYIEWLGLAGDPKLVILSSIHHYYYDAEEMKHVRTVVNLKELNHVKDIDGFLNSMFLILPPKCYLIGCFVDNKKRSGFSFRKRNREYDGQRSEDEKNGIISRVPFINTLFGFLDSKTNRYLTGKNVNALLRKNGFNVMDMTELDDYTYFCAQNQRTDNN